MILVDFSKRHEKSSSTIEKKNLGRNISLKILFFNDINYYAYVYYLSPGNELGKYVQLFFVHSLVIADDLPVFKNLLQQQSITRVLWEENWTHFSKHTHTGPTTKKYFYTFLLFWTFYPSVAAGYNSANRDNPYYLLPLSIL